MRRLLPVTIFGMLMGALWTSATTAADADSAKPPVGKEPNVELAVRVTGGEPQKPIGNAEVSVKGTDGADLQAPRRTDKKGEARFRDLSKGAVMVVVIAKDWKTFRAKRDLVKKQEVFQVNLQPLD